MSDKIDNKDWWDEESFRKWEKESKDILKSISDSFNKFVTSSNALISSQDDRLEQLVAQMKLTQKAVTDYAGSTSKAQKATDSLTNEFIAYNAQAQKLKVNTDAVRRVQKEAGTSVKAFDDEVKKLTKEFKLLDQAEESQAKKARQLSTDVIALKNASKQLNSALKANASQVATVAGSYDELVQRNKVLAREIKKTGNAFKGNNKQLVKLKKEFAENNDKLKKFDSDLGVHNRNVGNYQSALKGAVGKLGGVAAALGVTLIGVQALSAGLRFAITKFIDFEFTLAKVRAVSGANQQQFKDLEQNAKDLGASTQFAASQVAGLQLVLSKLGFKPEQIIDMTEAVLNLAIATGEDLAESASVAGSIIKGFGLKASDTGRVADVMAKAFSSSALDLSKFNESMKDAAPFANSANVSLEATTAALGALANQSIAGSRAGTAMKNILIELQNENSKLSKFLGFSVKSTEDFNKALRILKERGLNATKATALVGKISAGALKILADKAPDVRKLGDNFKNAAGSAAKMASVMKNTLQGSLDEAMSATESLAINVGDALAPAISVVVKGFTSMVNGINELVFGARKTKDAFEILNEAAFESEVQFTKEAQSATVLFDQLKLTTKGTAAHKAVKDKLLAIYPDVLKNYRSETGDLINIEAAQKAVIAKIKERITLEVNQKKIGQALSAQNKKQIQEITALKDEDTSFFSDFLTTTDVGQLQNLVKALAQVKLPFDVTLVDSQIEKLAKTSGEASITFRKLVSAFKGNASASDKFAATINPMIDSTKVLDSTIGDLLKTEDNNVKVIKETVVAEGTITKANDARSKALKFQIKQLQATTSVRSEEIKKQILLQQALLSNEKTNVTERANIIRQIATLEAQKVVFQKDAQKQIEGINGIINNDVSISAQKQVAIEKQKVNEILKINLDMIKKLEKEAPKPIKNITAQFKNFSKAIQKINDDNLKIQEDGSRSAIQVTADEFKAREEKAKEFNAKRIQQEKELANKRIDLLKEVLSFAQDLNDNRFERNIEQKELELESLEEQKEKELELAGDNEKQKFAITKSFATKEKQIQEEIKEEKRKQFVANKLFNAGQIAIDTAAAIMKTFAQFGLVAGTPLAIAMAAIGALQITKVLTQPVPAFQDGTEYLQLNGSPRGVDTIPALFEGRQMIRLDEGERILSKTQNKALGDLSNEEVVRAVSMANKSSYIPNTEVVLRKQVNMSIPGLISLEREMKANTSELNSIKHMVRNASSKVNSGKIGRLAAQREYEDKMFSKKRN